LNHATAAPDAGRALEKGIRFPGNPLRGAPMAIPQGKPSVTEHDRALGLFTDRDAERRLFIEYLHADPPVDRVIFLYGDGGNGKSLLLKHLKTEHCRLVSAAGWENLQRQQHADDRSFLTSFSDVADAHPIAVPCIYHDFSLQPRGGENPREDWSALMMLRRELGAHGLKLPLFDFAVVHYLHEVQRLSREQIRRRLPRDEADFASSLVDLATSPEIPVAGLAVKLMGLIDNHFGDRFAMWRARRGLNAERVEAIRRMDPRSELPDALPGLMGRDLKAAMGLPDAPKRLVLLFDTHEAFWGTGRHRESTQSFFERDEWLRRLLRELYHPNPGIVVAVAGREPPRWPEADPEDAGIPAEFLDPQLVGHLNRADAKDYLDRALARITDPANGSAPAPERFDALCDALIEHAEAQPGQVHPLYLGLAADVVLTGHEGGALPDPEEFPEEPDLAAKGRRLVNRLLRNCSKEVDRAVKALAAARSFDRELFRDLGARLGFSETRDAFDVLTDFSFVWRGPGGDEGRYRIHDLLRRILGDLAEEKTLEAHAALEAIYRDRAGEDPRALAEAIYHANRRDWERGWREWKDTMEEALKHARYPVCEALAELRPVLRLETTFAQGFVAQLAGELAQELSRYKTAESDYTQAIAAYDAALARAPDDVDAHNNKGLALQRLGKLRAALSDHKGAKEAYTQAVAAYDAALQLAPDYVAAHHNKGIALSLLGELRSALSDHTGAEEAYTQAIAACDAALQRAPDFVMAHNNKGNAFLGLGELQAALNDHTSAQANYGKAIHAYDEALQRAPDFVMAHHNKGIALSLLGELQAALSDHTGAEEAYTQAIAACDAALERAPDYINALANKGECLRKFAALALEQGDPAKARERLTAAGELLARAAQLAPNNKAIAEERTRVEELEGKLEE
jgi:tetratricopeptide (TPR) repeat protein